MQTIKDYVKRVPVIGPLARGARVTMKKATFPGSRAYWEANYAQGGTSGEGSYGKFAEFKAEVLNQFVSERRVQSVIEWGCGDGNQLSLADYPAYIGLDVSQSAIRRCIARFEHDPTKSFFWYDPECFQDHTPVFVADLSLSLDVIYHLIEDHIFDLYMNSLFTAAQKYVIIYSSDTDETPYLEAAHYRNRRFTTWVTAQRPDWELVQQIRNRYPFTGDPRTGSPSDFYIYEKRS